jgi:hypothetical protein
MSQGTGRRSCPECRGPCGAQGEFTLAAICLGGGPFLDRGLCMLAARTIENEYLRNPFDVRDGADKVHWLSAMA